MRPLALSALALFTVVGCGVPDNSALIARAEADAAGPKEGEAKKPDEKKPTDPKATPDAKAPEQDPAKLGIKITDVVKGTGPVAAPGDTLYMLYTGKLKSGKVFDSTEKHGGDPFSFVLGSGGVIKGWDLGIKGMNAGGKRTLDIPAEQGYGAAGSGDDIPPNSDLVFDVELVGVLKPEEADTVLRETVAPGAGPAAKPGDVVTIKYKATSLTGKLLDDNGGKPVQFKLGGGQASVPGLELAIQGMKKGQTVVATVPPALGPRAMGPGSKLTPNSMLKFEITLVSAG